MNRKQEKRFWSADQKRFVYSLSTAPMGLCFFSVRLAAQSKRGYERWIDDVIPMNAENAWIWQVETNVNLKKVDVL